MSAESLKSVRTRNVSTPQSEKAVKGQKKNAAGGFVFTISDIDRAKRFLILGASEGYYTSGAKFAKDNAKVLQKLIADGRSNELVDLIVDVSTNGRAAKQQPGLFALAVASSFGTTEEKQYALSKLPAVARTGTTLFEFVGFALQFRSWGRALKNAVAKWYTAKDNDKLAYQMVKYQSREGWSHKDLLRLTHPSSTSAFDSLAKWALGQEVDFDYLPRIVQGFEYAKTASSENSLIDYINSFDLTWEMVPNDKRSEKVWKVLVQNGLPLGALLRQLPTLTNKGVLKPLSPELALVVKAFRDEEAIKRARLHPIQILLALKTYESGGRYSRGNNTWTQVREVLDALNDAFYLAFATVVPSGKRFLLGLDVSGSMHGAGVNDSALTSAEAVGALSLVIQKTEPSTHTVAFAGGGRGYNYYGQGSNQAQSNVSGIAPMDISSAKRLDDVIKKMHEFDRSWSGTDCALPMKYALANKLEVDVFVIFTDNDTWSGGQHPYQALEEYRRVTGIPAKMIVLATSPSGFSIANPNDSGMLDIAGFDTTAPQVVSEFSKGL